MSNTMKLPKAVREANEKADKWAAENGMANAPSVETGTPAAIPVQPAAPVVTDTPRERIDPEDYKARFANYKRETDQTISEQRQQLGQLQQQNVELQRQLTGLVERLNAATPAPAKTPAAQGGKVTLDMIPEEIRDRYDDEFLEAVAQVAQIVAGSAGGVPKDIEARLNQIEANTTQLNSVAAKTAQQLFYESLDTGVPEWERIGQDQQWYDWLEITQINPPFDRRLARQVYGVAMKEMQSDLVVALLNRFKNETGWAFSGSHRTDLNSHVTPEGGAGGGALPSDLGEGAGVWTEDAINRFHTDITKGRYRGREAEAERITNEIQLAIQQGKVTPG